MISSSASSAIGGLNTFLWIVISAVIGMSILKNFKYSLMENIQKARTGQITQEEFIKTNVGRAIGALLLIVPGFFTDTIGIFLQFGLLISIFSKIFSFKVDRKQTNFNNTNYKGTNDEIIDVEIIDDNKSIKQ
jgi:2-isopropylmalate synthase/UPF0716 protein FxsA